MSRHLILLISLISLSLSVRAVTITHNPVGDEDLVLSILKLALSKSDPDAQFQPISEHVNQERSVQMIKSGSLSTMWFGTTPEYEQDLLPVRIPVLKGLLGHRLLIIR